MYFKNYSSILNTLVGSGISLWNAFIPSTQSLETGTITVAGNIPYYAIVYASRQMVNITILIIIVISGLIDKLLVKVTFM
jgi:hypothetical protein